MEEGRGGRSEEGEAVKCYRAGIPVGTLSRSLIVPLISHCPCPLITPYPVV